MNAIINRTYNKIKLSNKHYKERSAFLLAERYGYKGILIYKLSNYKDIKWEGIEFNRLMEKDNILYRFNCWYNDDNSQRLGFNQIFWDGIEIEEIGRIST